MRRRGRAPHLLAVALALGAALTACSDPFGPEQAELERARALWEARGAEDYRYEFRTLCFCLNLHGLVEVRDGAVVAVTDLETGEPVTGDPFDRYPTVEELFDTLAQWIAREPFRMEVTYDPELGYPRSASFDFEETVIDEEQAFEASGLVSIAEPPLGVTLPAVIVR